MSTPAISLSTLRLIWGTFMAAIVVYAGLAFVALRPVPAPHSELRWILLAMAAASGGALAAAFAFTGLITRRAEDYQQACIVRWAFVESVGVYGLVGRILGAGIGTCAVFMIVALVGLSMIGPSEDAKRQFDQERRMEDRR